MIRDLTIFIRPLPPGEGWGEVAFGKVHQLFGDKLNTMIGELLACACAEGRYVGGNETLAA